MPVLPSPPAPKSGGCYTVAASPRCSTCRAASPLLPSSFRYHQRWVVECKKTASGSASMKFNTAPDRGAWRTKVSGSLLDKLGLVSDGASRSPVHQPWDRFWARGQPGMAHSHALFSTPVLRTVVRGLTNPCPQPLAREGRRPPLLPREPRKVPRLPSGTAPRPTDSDPLRRRSQVGPFVQPRVDD